MAKWFPRNYVVVKDGAIEKIAVRDSTHETAIILKHPEAVGTNRPESFDDRRFVIKDTGRKGGD